VSDQEVVEAAPEAKASGSDLTWRLASYALAGVMFLGAFAAARWPVLEAAPPTTAPATATLALPTARPYAPEAPPVGLVLPGLDLTSQPMDQLVQFERQANPDTNIPSRGRVTIERYTVQAGDTVFGIAAQFNLDPETIIWGNPELATQLNLLVPGKGLNILPIDGALRVVQAGDTIDKIAEVYHGSVDEIVAFPGNDLDPENVVLTPGQNLIIPNGWRDTLQWQLPAPPPRRGGGRTSSGCAQSIVVGGFNFQWPANNRYLSGFDYNPNTHPGLDIAAGLGAPIYASETGTVVYAGWSQYGYGNLVIIDHGNGWQTVYAHLSQINTSCGQTASRGVVIGLSGSTGNSTGAHLHFEMRNDEFGRVNPWQFLP
jgi:murein DD-endopeptidase MepM/ murein hydrolase activator NlpD